MPEIQADGCPIHVEVAGSDRAPVLMLSNSLGTNLHMWDAQADELVKHFRLVRYDSRGHGKSGVPPGPYSIERLGRDAIAVMDGIGAGKVNFCGLSKGGMVGMWLGAHAPERIDRLILSNTACHMPATDLWNQRIATARRDGMAPLVEGVVERWFTKGFREREPDKVAPIRDMLLATRPEGYAACCEAIRDMDQRESIKRITASTLVICGRHDPATNVEAAEAIRSRIPGASLTILDAAHIANVEQPDDYTETVLGFFMQARV
jgi:3-oxoadipate enol-lactonase